MKDFTPATLDPVAVLVDGENISSAFADHVLHEVAAFGVATVRRVYGKPDSVRAWGDHGFRMVSAGAAKNAADIVLCVEAMVLALRERFQTIVIVSSDGDFATVIEQLRELGHSVIGIGDQRSPAALRARCSIFIEMRAVAVAEAKGEKPVAKKAVPKPTPLPVDLRLRTVIATHPARAEGVAMNQVGVLIKGETVIKQTSCATWKAYFKSKPDLYTLTGAADALRVRLKV